MTPDTQCKVDESPLAEAERLLTEALQLLDGSQAHLAAAYTATALDALSRYLDQNAARH
ncbi:hypothetical protein H7F50_16305 [Novosphingobium flavum]|uniref:Uncharacterized protein n=1 Tax=Novosphingobium aerophilum TaxID=2839843 RepID=A0A7X1KBP5_9SPHN|nr:hypothetical protein [Novosphingobium aerophilum]MBC2651423.1 hypothetical protein [Novosphingobium aerophilum]MBC2663312.1 hypothetical protein [Novosphingobium aerophilum]